MVRTQLLTKDSIHNTSSGSKIEGKLLSKSTSFNGPPSDIAISLCISKMIVSAYIDGKSNGFCHVFFSKSESSMSHTINVMYSIQANIQTIVKPDRALVHFFIRLHRL
jgi:hypothetical protein